VIEIGDWELESINDDRAASGNLFYLFSFFFVSGSHFDQTEIIKPRSLVTYQVCIGLSNSLFQLA
jgi:hypothetical protein